MKNIFYIAFIMLFTSVSLLGQHNHVKELGLKGHVKKVSTVYYAKGKKVNGQWVPNDTTKFTYKTVGFYNHHQNLDSVHTFVNHSGHERLISRKLYEYEDKKTTTGVQIDLLDDIQYDITTEWIDRHTYIERAQDLSGMNRIVTKIWMDNKHHIIKDESELYRDGELYDHSITITKFNPDNTEHAVSIRENKIANLEYSMDEYIDQRDEKGNPVKKSYKDGVNSFRSVKYYIIEYYD